MSVFPVGFGSRGLLPSHDVMFWGFEQLVAASSAGFGDQRIYLHFSLLCNKVLCHIALQSSPGSSVIWQGQDKGGEAFV
jgi:hypothetical protein